MPAKKAVKRTNLSKIKKASDVSLIKTDKILVRHLRLVHHKHTSRLIHHRHTSHFSLTIILVLLGVLMCFTSENTGAVMYSGGVSVGVVVPGPPPAVGAEITYPSSGIKLVDKNSTLVSGNCHLDTMVVIKNNGVLAGTVNCDTSSKFRITIELNLGKNTLSAINYDNLNQPGPVTPSVDIEVEKTSNGGVIIPEKNPIVPVLPDNPSVIPVSPSQPSVPPVAPVVHECNDYKVGDLPYSATPRVSVVCVPRFFGPNVDQVMGVLVWGGQAPYALSVDLGDKSDNSLRSFASSGYYRVAFKYKTPGKYSVAVKVTDNKSQTSSVLAAVVVNGSSPSVETPITTVVDNITKKSWFETPVPSYIMALGITLGFWGGDLFDRYFGSKKPQKRTRKIA